MKHLIRSIKYFFYFATLTSLIILALVMTGMADGNIETMFKGGYDAFWKIALFFAVIAAYYPKVGFISREVSLKGEWSDAKGTIISYFQERNFILEKDNDDILIFRHRSILNRITRMYEDQITLTKSENGFVIEGLRKDVFRISTTLEYLLNPQQD